MTFHIKKIVSLFRFFITFTPIHQTPNKKELPFDRDYDWLELSTLDDPDILNLKLDDPDFDLFNKESIMKGIKIVVKQVRRYESKQSYILIDYFINIMSALHKYNTNEYLIWH